MPVIGIAGDSFFAPTQDIASRSDCAGSKGKHFSEIMSKFLGYDLLPLSRGAVSNSVIRLQVQELVKKKVDFVIYGTTSSGRLEYPSTYSSNYAAESGIYNFDYSTHPDLSSLNPNFGLNSMQSETISTVLGGYGMCTENQKEAIEMYFKELFDERYRQVQDAFIISSGVQELIDNKIPYICLFDDFVELIPYFSNPNKRIIIKDRSLLPFRYDSYDEETGNDTHRRYHVSDKNQVVIAYKLCQYIRTNNLLVWS